ncbi:MAG: hypothetical protein VB050_06895 [Geobacteraceae bacterium]|nr:hypothetical protein [Geobacteraceae bacterium]
MITYLPYIVTVVAVAIVFLVINIQTRQARKHREETDQFMAALGQRISSLEEEFHRIGDKDSQLNDLKITQLRDELKTTLDNFRDSISTKLNEHESMQSQRLTQFAERLSASMARQTAPATGNGQAKAAAVKAPPRETPIHDKAKRLARLIVADIALYNGPAVDEGVRNNTFAKLLSHEIKEARALYAQRVPEDVRKDTTYLEDAFRELIVRKKRELNIQ